MKIPARALLLFLFVLSASCVLLAQSDLNAPESALRNAFIGKQVLLKIDMPGTQKGVDLHFDRESPMDWEEYGNRIKAFGPALRNGDRATITQIVVKRDHIELQFDGGGFGTAHDNASTTISARIVPKSERQERMERELKNETDPDRRRDLRHDIDREESRRQYLQSQQDAAAQVASQLKAQDVADHRLRGGSRFNLRWKDVIPPDQLTADAVRQRLADFMDFTVAQSVVPPPPPQQQMRPSDADTGCRTSAVTALYVGMRMDEVRRLLGPGQLVNEERTESGLLNQEFTFATNDAFVRASFVNGIVVRYNIQSR